MKNDGWKSRIKKAVKSMRRRKGRGYSP